MANDRSLSVRRGIVTALRANGPLIALVPAPRIYGPATPATPVWPFIRCGAFTVLPSRQSCNDGSLIVGAIHGFAVGPGEDAAARINAAMAKAIDGLRFVTVEGDDVELTWTGGQLLRDTDEADAWHAVCDFEADVVCEE